MSRQPRVTVVIPSYNHARYVATAIESVLAQTYENVELIVADDGSSDGSHAVINTYGGHPKIKAILDTENRGQSAVINQALSASTGEYVAILPSDDWFLPEKTAAQVTKMESCGEDVGVVYGAGARYFEDTGETVRVKLPVHTGWIARHLIENGNFIYPVTPLYRRTVLERIRPSEEFRAEGEAIHLRIALHYRYEYVDRVVAVMRDHSYNIGKDASLLHAEIDKHLEWYFSLPDLPEDIQALRGRALFRNHAVKGLQLIVDRRNFAMGRSCLKRAFALNPRALLVGKYAVAFFITLLPPTLANAALDGIKGRRTRTIG